MTGTRTYKAVRPRLNPALRAIACCCFLLPGRPLIASPLSSLWAHDNLQAWCVVPADTRRRSPEERARMLAQLGFKRFAYDWREANVPEFDAEIDALQRHGITLTAWWFPYDISAQDAHLVLDAIGRHHIHPQLWVNGDGGPTHTPEEQRRRVEAEAQRIRALVQAAEPLGCQVELYNYDQWFGEEANEIAVIESLRELGIGGVGLVYNFHHGQHDIAHFAQVWKSIQPYVVAINLSGMSLRRPGVLPLSAGEEELGMMRIIENSGWRGPVGLLGERPGNVEEILRGNLRGLDWLAAELHQPGSGGPPPFPPPSR